MQLNFHAENDEDFLNVNDYSKFRSLQRKVAYLRRPFRNWRNKRKTPSFSQENKNDVGPPALSAAELQEAEIWLVKREQAKHFGKEAGSLMKARRNGVESLSKGNPISKT